ncbi:uncharacterized protein MYCGRDRAFT_89608 [Zymoseptoria tritici IPO323]|uniref:Uncharacterized protein n=1 Tax=Zymoseptoria tritici (strain CBS 115943 / IPO323) TaxID=336722 RepID=F9WZC6_ZYMTI|nr:uncharacterized protein MYCGRDRAFT_89608 [Zymoseptoria tritici IPO323]EGP92225.1 hypothetical protein MYCGRDRAFT_89608 [Zymoseptoria tritici IPO323]
MPAQTIQQQPFVSSIRTVCKQASLVSKKSLKKLRKLFNRPQKEVDSTDNDVPFSYLPPPSRGTVRSFLDPATTDPRIRRQTFAIHEATLAALEQPSSGPVRHSVRFSHPAVGAVLPAMPSPATAIVEEYSPVEHYRFHGGAESPRTEDFPQQVNPSSVYRTRAARTSYAETVAALDGVRGFSAMITQPPDTTKYHYGGPTKDGRPPTLPCLPYLDPQIPASAFDDPPEDESLTVEEIRQAALDKLNAIAEPAPLPDVKAAHPTSLHPGPLVFKSRPKTTEKEPGRKSYQPFNASQPSQDLDDELLDLYASLSPGPLPSFPSTKKEKRGTRMYEQHQSLRFSPNPAPSEIYTFRSETPDFPSPTSQTNRKSMLQKQYQDLLYTPQRPFSPTSVYSTTPSGRGPIPDTPGYGYPGLPTLRYTVARKGMRQPPPRPKNPSPPPTPSERSQSVSEFLFQAQPAPLAPKARPAPQSNLTSPPGLTYSSSKTTTTTTSSNPAAIAAAKALYRPAPSAPTTKRKELNIHEIAGIKTGRSTRAGAEVGLPAAAVKIQGDDEKGKGKKSGGFRANIRKAILKDYEFYKNLE